MSGATDSILDQALRAVGIAPGMAKNLKRLGIETVRDLPLQVALAHHVVVAQAKRDAGGCEAQHHRGAEPTGADDQAAARLCRRSVGRALRAGSRVQGSFLAAGSTANPAGWV